MRHAPLQRGFTVLELLLGLALFGVVTLTAFVVFNANFRGLLAGMGFADEQQNARLVLERTTRRIRMAGVGTPAGTVEFITEGGANTIAFRTDADGNGVVEWYRYCLEPTQGVVREQVGTSGSPPGSCTTSDGAPITSRGLRPLRVAALSFRYFRGDDVELTSLPLGAPEREQVRRVRIRLVLDSNRSGAQDMQDLEFNMDVVLRN